LFFVRREKSNYTIPVNSDMCRVIRKLTFKVFEVKKKKKRQNASAKACIQVHKEKKENNAPRLVAQRQRQGFLASVTWVRALACMSVIPVVSYLPTGLAGCSVGPGISCVALKLTLTPRVTKKKKKKRKIT
jgi:hypothetical protein